MSEITAKRIKSDISIRATVPIDSVAETISNALCVSLDINSTGKFEEFVGYEGSTLGIKITLVSDPKSPESDYDLSFYGSHGEEGETIEITSFILATLNKSTDLICRKMI
jgi:hypothetical protein